LIDLHLSRAKKLAIPAVATAKLRHNLTPRACPRGDHIDRFHRFRVKRQTDRRDWLKPVPAQDTSEAFTSPAQAIG
jgi:hypothetical protein